MATKVKYLGLALILIGALVLILSHFCGWNNINSLNVSTYAVMIIGFITYIIAGKKSLEE
ncbi:MAG: hypothetical protein IJY98_05010 [Bacteroidaceae bacterium]|nr:hypothetical protein [Bacteroidales bacterium]MBO5264315.1 hypothetical protein [Bacteroidaceae bacterium]MBQ8257260.1 hypothetical protein [Bacteroidaceae bacterium]